MVTDNAVDLTNIAAVVAANPLPVTFQGNAVLFALNLFMMTAFTAFGIMVAGWMAGAIIRHRRVEKLWDPATIYRLAFMCAGLALFVRCGADAAVLWSWDENAPQAAANVQELKRRLDPLALMLAAGWLTLHCLSYPSMMAQLRKKPYPVKMLARIPALKRPGIVVVMSFVAAGAIAWMK